MILWCNKKRIQHVWSFYLEYIFVAQWTKGGYSPAFSNDQHWQLQVFYGTQTMEGWLCCCVHAYVCLLVLIHLWVYIHTYICLYTRVNIFIICWHNLQSTVHCNLQRDGEKSLEELLYIGVEFPLNSAYNL